MVEVSSVQLLSEIREQTKSREFPEQQLKEIKSAVSAVPPQLFLDNESGREIRKFDAMIAESLDEFEFEHEGEQGRNPKCKLWSGDGFDHSVDLYHEEDRIAIEIEKSERKRVSDDILKFILGGKTIREGRDAIEFGALIVPTNYRGSDNIYKGTINTLQFLRRILFVEDIAVIGYQDPRHD